MLCADIQASAAVCAIQLSAGEGVSVAEALAVVLALQRVQSPPEGSWVRWKEGTAGLQSPDRIGACVVGPGRVGSGGCHGQAAIGCFGGDLAVATYWSVRPWPRSRKGLAGAAGGPGWLLRSRAHSTVSPLEQSYREQMDSREEISPSSVSDTNGKTSVIKWALRDTTGQHRNP
ncbi:hypothetical protein MHYP_G00027940 [Metynnis hypsauchen]